MGGFAQVPLAQLDRVIADLLQQLTNGDFRGRHAHLLDGDDVFLPIGEKNWVADTVMEGPNIAREFQVHRREFKPIPGGIATGHQGCAGWGACTMARIGLSEICTLAAYGIDIGRWNQPTSDAAAVEGDVVIAKVIGHDDDDVGLLSGLGRCCGPLLPRHILRRPNTVLGASSWSIGGRLRCAQRRHSEGHQAGNSK